MNSNIYKKLQITKFFFPIYSTFYLKLKAYIKYSKERAILKGKNLTDSNKESILIFTTHKCASTFLGKLSKILSEHSDRINLNPEAYSLINYDYIFEQALENDQISNVINLYDENEDLKQLKNNLFKTKGFIYSPLRQYYNLSQLNEYKIILILRDPRDVLVSYYYSIAYSHSIIHKYLIKLRERALKNDIDEFVIYMSEFFLNIYQSYLNLLNNDNVFYIKYEDMISNPSEFLENIQNFTDIKLPDEVVKNILNTELALPKNEDIHSHRRSGKSGAYKEKLNEETINYLNDKFKDIITNFGF